MANDPIPIKPPRSWQDIARELSAEKDSNKVTRLAGELNQALLDEEVLRRKPVKRANAVGY